MSYGAEYFFPVWGVQMEHTGKRVWPTRLVQLYVYKSGLVPRPSHHHVFGHLQYMQEWRGRSGTLSLNHVNVSSMSTKVDSEG